MGLNESSLRVEVDYVPREEVEFDGIVTDPEMARLLIGSHDLPDLAGYYLDVSGGVAGFVGEPNQISRRS